VVDIRLKTFHTTLVNGVYEETFKMVNIHLQNPFGIPLSPMHFLQEEIFEVVDISLETSLSLRSDACPNCPISVDNTFSLCLLLLHLPCIQSILCPISKGLANLPQCKQSYVTAE